MKTTIKIEIEETTPEYVWLVICEHKKSSTSNEFSSHDIFRNEDDARKYMQKEIRRTGQNMYNYFYCDKNFSIRHDKYESCAIISQNGKKIDEYCGYMYKERIN